MDNHNTPFVSTPFSPELELMPVNSMPPNVQSGPMLSVDQMENEYPEIYFGIYPQITDTVDKLMASGYNPTSEMINSLVDAIIKNSGMWYEDDDNDNMPEAIPVQMGFGGNPFRRRRKHHNRNTLRDITRILLLRELFDRKNHRPRPRMDY